MTNTNTEKTGQSTIDSVFNDYKNYKDLDWKKQISEMKYKYIGWDNNEQYFYYNYEAPVISDTIAEVYQSANSIVVNYELFVIFEDSIPTPKVARCTMDELKDDFPKG